MNRFSALQAAPNFRDLGGMTTEDGRKIRHHRLLRSGHLADLTAEDQQLLTGEYQLKTVVDLRTTGERAHRPDVTMPGVAYLHCPIFDHAEEGVTREQVTVEDPVTSALAMARRMEGQAFSQMTQLYTLFFEEPGIAHYRQFFEILLRQEQGAVLWHCTMGKDRCGTAAVLLETALGVPWSTVLEDYLFTNVRLGPITEAMIQQARPFAEDERLLEQMRILDSAREEFLQAAVEKAVALSGSLEGFLRDELGLSDTKREKLREMYLE